ncbi:MAG: hypothetical protein QME70_00950 [Bacillota bacterium]|nr:hypothetical protein [Bacillota bacterium]
MRIGAVRWATLLLAVVTVASLALGPGCFRRQAREPVPPSQPGPAPSETTPGEEKRAWAVLEPGLKLTYGDGKTGQETWSEQCAASTLDDKEVIPVVAEDGEYVSYVAEQDGWLVEIGARDPNGRAAWPEPLRRYPLDPAVGMKWETEEEGGIFRHEIEAIEEVSVPAGKFRAARVAIKVVDPASGKEERDSEQRFWYDVDTGIVVKTGDLVLVKQEKVEPRPDPGLPR